MSFLSVIFIYFLTKDDTIKKWGGGGKALNGTI